MASLQIKRGLRSQLDATATANGLKVGELYLITDEDRLAVGTAINAYQVVGKADDFATAAQGTLADTALQPGDVGVTVQGYDANTAKYDINPSNFTGIVQGTRFISTQATGTAPFTVSSTTVVPNLNADLLDGYNIGQTGTNYIPYADSNGRVGIGTTTPVANLQVINHLAISNSAGNQAIALGNTIGGGADRPAIIQSSNGNLFFGYGNTWDIPNVSPSIIMTVRDDKVSIGNGYSPGNEKLSVIGNVEATRFISTQTTGTAPLTVSSTTVVTNLNADQLDGKDASAFSERVAVPATASSTGTTGQIAFDSSYFYACVATDTWVRAPLATW